MLKCTARGLTPELVSVILVSSKETKKGLISGLMWSRKNMCKDVYQNLPVNSHVTLFFLMRVCITQTKTICTESVPVKLFSVWNSSFVSCDRFLFLMSE